MMLSGWGNYPRAECRTLKWRDAADLSAILANEPRLIARGLGRAYGDAALQPEATISMLGHDRILAFDGESGRITCESGVTLGDLLSVFVPRGWFPPVTPGTRHVTLGGMIASDVHGKNHHKCGSFSKHVEVLELMLADGRVVRCSTRENPDLFEATCGGMGLTGLILTATFSMIPVETAWIRQETIRTHSLEEMMQAFEDSSAWTYTVAWIDCHARGDALGRGLLFRGEHATRDETREVSSHPLAIPRRRQVSIPTDLPMTVLNRMTVGAFNELYWRRGRPGTRFVPYDAYFYPLDSVLHWNRIYGRNGFVQYQCVLPKNESALGLKRLLAAAEKAGTGSFLAVLKLLGPQDGMLAFPFEGYTIALDFPVSKRLTLLLDEMDQIVAEHGGRLYLAKDSRSRPDQLRRGYRRLDEFAKVRDRFDSAHRFSSLLSERLAL